MNEIQTTPSLPRTRAQLAPGDRADLAAVMQDRFQSPRARRRAHALILLDDGVSPEVVYQRTSVAIQSQREMVKRMRMHGVSAAIFGSPRAPAQRRYDVAVIAKILRTCLSSRPPVGALHWNLEHLATVVREQAAGAATISKETIRFLLKKELGIESIGKVDPYWLIQLRRRKAARAPKPGVRLPARDMQA